MYDKSNYGNRTYGNFLKSFYFRVFYHNFDDLRLFFLPFSFKYLFLVWMKKNKSFIVWPIYFIFCIYIY